MRHGFIGYGNLISAIHNKLTVRGCDSFICYTKNDTNNRIRTCHTIQQLVKSSDVIWLGVKPQNLDAVLEELKETTYSKKLVVSPVAGKSIAYLQERLGYQVAIVRIMPNLALEFGSSVTAYAHNKIYNRFRKQLLDFLRNSGQLIEIEETHFHLFTAIFGSGPAFLLKLLDIQKPKIMELGIPEPQVNIMLAGLMEGTADYYRSKCNSCTIEELISKIASEGGTTQAGLKYLQENSIDKLYENVINIAQRRSYQLGSPALKD